MRALKNILITAVILTSCKSSDTQLVIMPAFPNLSFEYPVDIQFPDDNTNRLFVLSQPGVIYVFENRSDVASKKVFLDISSKVLYGGEQGLLGLAFHPYYKTNGYFYIDYTTDNPRRTIVSRFRVSADDPDKAEPSSETILLEVPQPYSNHNGGQIVFGGDGYLYISFGDGGSAGDPQNNAQNLQSLLGKILRIDVNNRQGNLNYSIPPDNPFAGNSNGYRKEIYAYGLRNPWRFSFDKETNRLWAADVGQNTWEEIDLIEKGKNYGWRTMEGFHCYNPSHNCDTTGLTMPIWEYGHDVGYSITGGYVYRGSSAASLIGKYIYGDYGSGNIWALDYTNNTPQNTLLFPTVHNISTFGVDQNNELLFASYAQGKLYKIVEQTAVEQTENRETPSEIILKQNFPNLDRVRSSEFARLSPWTPIRDLVRDEVTRRAESSTGVWRPFNPNYAIGFETCPRHLVGGK